MIETIFNLFLLSCQRKLDEDYSDEGQDKYYRPSSEEGYPDVPIANWKNNTLVGRFREGPNKQHTSGMHTYGLRQKDECEDVIEGTPFWIDDNSIQMK